MRISIAQSLPLTRWKRSNSGWSSNVDAGDGTPVIGLTLRYDGIDNFRFCLLHELSHVINHLTLTEQIIIDDLELQGFDSFCVTLSQIPG
jgi:hypothetical protein